MVEGMIFHFRDRKTFLNATNPLIKLISVLCCSILLVGSNLPRTLLVGGTLFIISLFLRLPYKSYFKESIFFLFMAAFIAVTEWLATKNINATAAASLRFLSIVLAGMILADTTAPDDLSRSLGSLLDKIPGLNGYKIASSIELTLAIIPMIFDVAMGMHIARHCRLERTWRHPIRFLISYCSDMFSLLLDRIDDLSIALDARAYDPSAKRKAPPYSYRDLILFLGTAMLVAAYYVIP